MPEIALIQPDSPFLAEPLSLPSLGLLYISSFLKKNGFNPKLYDLTGGVEPPIEELAGFDIVAFTCQTPHFQSVLQLKKRLYELNPDLTSIIGGPYPTFCTEECLKNGFTVVKGEGEIAVEEICKNGVNTGVYEGTPLYTDYIDSLFPDWGAIDIHRYKYHLDGKKCMSIFTSRGSCPYRCAFCAKMKSKIRFRSAESVIREASVLREYWGIGSLMIYDDTMLIEKKRDFSIFKGLKELDMPFRCMTRSNLATKNDITRLKEYGCSEVCIGVESADNRILSAIGKGITIEQDTKFVEMCHDAGLRVKTYLIIGLPGEDMLSVHKMRDWLIKTKPDNYDISIFVPYPGSDIYRSRKNYEIFWDDEKLKELWFAGSPQYDDSSAVWTPYLTAEQIVSSRNQIIKEIPRNVGGTTSYWGPANIKT